MKGIVLDFKKHPHARGEDSSAAASAWARSPMRVETPPRTWGRRSRLMAYVGLTRNTPTHVGKTRDVSAGFMFDKKHPHARGEDTSPTVCWTTTSETPPRTWGRPHLRSWSQLAIRNTPTHVGKTAGRRSQKPACQKHPHARGEDPVITRMKSDAGETPPRTWGRHVQASGGRSVLRNTPTHVGKTGINDAEARKAKKHPHARGEDFMPPIPSSCPSETPPRTWGRQLHVLRGRHGWRNTPTHVGKTSASREERRIWQKHPHARGEDVASLQDQIAKIETPPRTWGRLEMATVEETGSEKHPHARGEDPSQRSKVCRAGETPPRTWGRQGIARSISVMMRNTPTHVGKTR